MNKVVHFEVPADDLKRAQEFYTKVFGWEIKDYGLPGMEYLMVRTVDADEAGMPKEAGAINGGMQKRMNPSESVVIVLNVSSVDEYLKKVEEAGGKMVMPKMQVSDMGYYARVTDTEGNVIGIWENIKHVPPSPKATLD